MIMYVDNTVSCAITVGYLHGPGTLHRSKGPEELEGALQVRGAVRVEQGPAVDPGGDQNHVMCGRGLYTYIYILYIYPLVD